ncbi:MAG: M48 family metallopeptidase [Cyanobacteria bacterium J06588_5]
MPIELPPGTAAYSEDTPPANNRQLLTLLGLFLLGIGLAVGLALWLAGAVVWLIPTSVEQQLGRAIVPVYEAQSKPSATQDVLNELLDRLEAHLPAEQAERDYQVLYVPEDVVNAIAIPGDRVIIYKGLLTDVESENELMMVLGHELGHFANRDHLRGLSRQVMLQLVLSGVFGDLGSVGAIATNSVSALSNAQFSQKQEKQADQLGLRLLAEEYGHAAGATAFFSRLAAEGELQNLPGMAIFASHPPSAERVRAIEQQIEQQGYSIKETAPLAQPLEEPQ